MKTPCSFQTVWSSRWVILSSTEEKVCSTILPINEETIRTGRMLMLLTVSLFVTAWIPSPKSPLSYMWYILLYAMSTSTQELDFQLFKLFYLLVTCGVFYSNNIQVLIVMSNFHLAFEECKDGCRFNKYLQHIF